VGAAAGALELHINTANPTISTFSEAFLRAAYKAPGWEGQTWDDQIVVEVVTLDLLIARYGIPVFAKIDVEGWEEAVIRGLSWQLKALSFEFTTLARDVARACLKRLSLLANYRYNLALGESQALIFEHWLSADQIEHHLSNLPHTANSGDVYARLHAQSYSDLN
jgi:hypothetical protein